MEKNDTFKEEVVIGYSDVPLKKKQHPWRKLFYDRPGALLTVARRGVIFYNGQCQHLGPGDLALYDALPLHSFAGESDWTYYWFHLPRSFFDEYRDYPYNTEVAGVRVAHFEQLALSRIRLELQEAYLLSIQQPQHWEKLCELLLRVVLVRAFDCINNGHVAMPSPFQNAIRHLEFFDTGKTMEEIARACGMSRSVFFSRFQSEYGCTPIEYRDNLIISKAKTLLASTNLQIREISSRLHFQDHYYFSKYFFKRTGQTASAFRASHRREAVSI